MKRLSFHVKSSSKFLFSKDALLIDVDYIFPKSLFKRRNLEKIGIGENKIDIFINDFDFFANLQLLKGILNIEKSNNDFREWLHTAYHDSQARQTYMERDYVNDIDLCFEKFNIFTSERINFQSVESCLETFYLND